MFNKTSSIFKQRLKSNIIIIFCEENRNDDHLIQKKSKKYPSWAKFWHDFSLSAFVNGDIPWENINDNLVYERHNTYQKDKEQANLILGFNFSQEYKRLNKIYPDPILENKIKKHKNFINKKVS